MTISSYSIVSHHVDSDIIRWLLCDSPLHQAGCVIGAFFLAGKIGATMVLTSCMSEEVHGLVVQDIAERQGLGDVNIKPSTANNCNPVTKLGPRLDKSLKSQHLGDEAIVILFVSDWDDCTSAEYGCCDKLLSHISGKPDCIVVKRLGSRMTEGFQPLTIDYNALQPCPNCHFMITHKKWNDRSAITDLFCRDWLINVALAWGWAVVVLGEEAIAVAYVGECNTPETFRSATADDFNKVLVSAFRNGWKASANPSATVVAFNVAQACYVTQGYAACAGLQRKRICTPPVAHMISNEKFKDIYTDTKCPKPADDKSDAFFKWIRHKVNQLVAERTPIELILDD
eukprot:GHVU01220919.1.p1 GENE.GHVU01220919.1~~GHVU01220919.1.p1  ORF type:complete len:342 (-),score=26.42 GHVU01220919.1:541-1566(-)